MTTSTIGAALAILLAAATQTAPGQTPEGYPSKTVTLIVPTAPAGGTDVFARLFAERLGKVLNQQFVVDNKPGANGMLGTQLAARATADGHTLLFTYAAAHVANPSLYKSVPYDAVKDFAPVVQIGRAANMLLVRPDFPARTLREFVDIAKARPDKLNYCSWGIGSGGHLTMESLKKQAGLALNHIPYKGNALCIQDLLGGQVDTAFGDVSSNIAHVKAGKLRALVYAGPARLPMLPDVPTMNEAGYPFTTYAWYGVFAPAGTPPAIVRKLNAAVLALLADPAMKQRLNELNLNDLPITTPEQFGDQVRKDIAAWGRLVREINVTLD